MEETKAKTIQIFLPDGNPRSMRIAEITSRTIKAMQIPRSGLEFAFQRNELKNVGLYFLIGVDEDETKGLVYIGEAEDCLTRIKQQNKDKEFWNDIIVIISKTYYFTKSHVKYLEHYCYEKAVDAGRYTIVNESIPTKSYIPEPDEADLMDNFETLKVLLSTLGFPLFEKIPTPKPKNILYCKSKDADAQGEYTNEGFVVFAKSRCNIKPTPTISDWIVNMRDRLIKDGVLVQNNNVYEFRKDHIFQSPSAAAGVILARSANGWTSWKYKDGRTLDEVKRQNISE